MDALFNEDYKETEKKKQKKQSKGKNKKKQSKGKKQKKTTLTKKELQEFNRMWNEMDETCTCEPEETDGFNLDECECDKEEEYNQYEGETHCCECDDLDCEMHPMHLIRDTYALVDKNELTMYIGEYLANEIMSNVCRNMIHIIEIKDTLFSIEDEEIREEALDRVKMVQENLCNTIELIRIAPDTVHKIV